MPKRLQDMLNCLDQILHQIMHVQSESMEKLSSSLSVQELRIIYFLGQHGEKIMRQISNNLQLSVSNTSILVDKLKKRNLITRQRSTKDRRIVYVKLTSGGRKIHQIMLKRHLEFAQHMLDGLNEKDQESLIELLQKILKTSTQFHAPQHPNDEISHG